MKKPYLETGKIVSVHGVHGAVKVLPWADSPDFLLQFDTFYLPGQRAMTVEKAAVQGTCVLLKLAGVDTVEEAQALRNQVLSIRRDDPHIPAGTVFQADLIGMPVRADGREIGKLAEILTMPASDVWVVRGEKEYMIPCVSAFVPSVDPTPGYLEVHLIEGMARDAD